MAPNDRWVWLGFGIFFYAAVRLIRYGLEEVYEVSFLSREEQAQLPSGTDQSTPPPEDSISLSALTTLTKSPNRTLAASATTILINRFLADQSEQARWLDDLFSTDKPTRKRADLLLSHLRNDTNATIPATSRVEILASLIDVSLGRNAGPALTVQRAYHHVRTAGRSHANTRLEQVSRTMNLVGDSSVILCPDMREQQVGPWLEATNRYLWLQSNMGDKGALAAALARMNAAGHGEGPTLAEWEAADAGNEDVAGRALGLRAGNVPRAVRANHDPDELHGMTDQFRAWLQVRRDREMSFEEEEVRRRRREAVVLHESDRGDGQEATWQTLDAIGRT